MRRPHAALAALLLGAAALLPPPLPAQQSSPAGPPPAAEPPPPPPLPVFGGGEEAFLEPDAAFEASVEVRDARTLVASWRIAPGYYLYRDKLRFELEEAPGVALGSARLPAGTDKEDPYFGRVRVLHEYAEAVLPLERRPGGARSVRLAVRYQGCAEAGLCYPPIRRSFTLALPPLPAGAAETDRPPA